MFPYSPQCYVQTLSIIFFLLLRPPRISGRPPPWYTVTSTTDTPVKEYNNYTWHNFKNFLNAKRGSHVTGMSQLKRYFNRFGYLSHRDFVNITDSFDAHFESAVFRYQTKLGLPVTGKLDFDTISEIMSPRCGVPDTVHKFHALRNYEYFPGKPRWTRHTPMNLTYAFSPENRISYLKLSDIKGVFKKAFGRWESVIPVTFIESDDYGFADIKIGFYSGDHGDGEAFDGVLGVLAHSFSPESGKFHLDGDETWAVDFEIEKSKVAVDLESVAVHEIGHLLGLAHSSDKEAVMYPSLKPRKKKVDLSVDDVKGIQALYGSNPNFTLGSLLESDISTSEAVSAVIIRSSDFPAAGTVAAALILIILCFYL
ncbi:metalloendoproteinase 4-MMP [Euphorbia lathyris]|uniref:metalloendoproteinase 4-MMP n=1 Tax=Euphorbia lathyris TaxID=212925 RepID=UPI0033136137